MIGFLGAAIVIRGHQTPFIAHSSVGSSSFPEIASDGPIARTISFALSPHDYRSSDQNVSTCLTSTLESSQLGIDCVSGRTLRLFPAPVRHSLRAQSRYKRMLAGVSPRWCFAIVTMGSAAMRLWLGDGTSVIARLGRMAMNL